MQELLAILVVLVAFAHLAGQIVSALRTPRPDIAAGDCGSCPASDACHRRSDSPPRAIEPGPG